MADLLACVRTKWAALARVPDAFPDAGLTIVTSPGSSLCPPGWVGLVVLGASGLVTTPTDAHTEAVRRALSGLPVGAVTDPVVLRRLLPVAGVLGPAALSYLDDAQSLPRPASSATVRSDDTDLVAFLDDAGDADAGESGLREVTSPLFVVRVGPRIVAAAGYQVWPGSVAHLGVLTAATHRGRGHARAVASAAARHALAAGLLPQWRARPEASRRVATSLGFRHIGDQLSVQLS